MLIVNVCSENKYIYRVYKNTHKNISFTHSIHYVRVALFISSLSSHRNALHGGYVKRKMNTEELLFSVVVAAMWRGKRDQNKNNKS